MRIVNRFFKFIFIPCIFAFISSSAIAQTAPNPNCRTGEEPQACQARLEMEAARRVRAAKQAQAEFKGNCAYADRYTDRGGEACSEVVKQMNGLEKRTDAMSGAANNVAMISSQVAMMRAKNNAAGTQQANGQILNSSAVAMIARGAAELSEGQQLRSLASKANQSKENVAQAAERFNAIKTSCQQNSMENGNLIQARYEDCVVTETEKERHKFGAGIQGSYLYGNHATDGSKQLDEVAKLAKDNANSKQMNAASSLLGGIMAMKMAKQSEQNANNLTTLQPNTYRINMPNLNQPGETTGTSVGETTDTTGKGGEFALPSTAGGAAIKGGLENKHTGSGAYSTYSPNFVSGSSGGGVSAGGVPSGGASRTNAEAPKKPRDKLMGEITAGSDFNRVSNNNGAQNGGANAAAMAKCLLNPAMPECANITGAKEIALGGQKPDRKIASDTKNAESTANLAELSLFDQVSSKIRWLSSNGAL